MKKAHLFLAMSSLLSIQTFANPFIDDLSMSLTTRNYYLNRDFTDFKPIAGSKDWAQGFIFKINSGYTPGKVGFGLDMQTLTSVKLQGDSKYLGSGLLTTDAVTRERADTASEIGLTGKMKYKNTELKVGTIQPWTPVIFSSPSRLLPQTFRGAIIQSTDVKNLELTAAYIDQVNHRDSTNNEDLSNIGFNGRFQSAKTDHFSMLGAKYNLSPKTQAGIYYGIAKDLYNQAAINFKNTYAIKDDTQLITDLRLWNSRDNGEAKAGKIDNSLITANLGLNHQNHTLTLSTMQNYGDTAHPYLSGGEVLIFIDGWSTDFLNPNERVYSVRYDYDFKNYIPGLKFMTRYTKGKNIHLPHLGGNHLKEDSLDFDLQYTVQTGRLKGLGLRGRYAHYDNNFAQNASFKPANETRINIDYTWKFK
ncbi:OprD family porin [Acinetobacter qingfengensis]|uniref:Porin n=1 Tax=Acinetobacter qingfengensis TaxID=1262585 RepID=A0A1E7R3W4_9GAMM|nr:OprD family outer membrane porin [Acinetobacter qingfengensis]KAA8731487.1 OprD family porin [Acinetobacter qingfengensis]OEY93973.1 porin [Acinetobacter qingfengensis]